MSPAVQFLLVVLGVVLTALVTTLISVLVGIKSDLRDLIEAQRDYGDRLIRLETEHAARACQRGAA